MEPESKFFKIENRWSVMFKGELMAKVFRKQGEAQSYLAHLTSGKITPPAKEATDGSA